MRSSDRAGVSHTREFKSGRSAILNLDTFRRTGLLAASWNRKPFIFSRHHPLSHSANEIGRTPTSGKLRQKAAMNLLQFVAFCERAFAALCRLQPKDLLNSVDGFNAIQQRSIRVERNNPGLKF